jgi:hypothetical protein
MRGRHDYKDVAGKSMRRDPFYDEQCGETQDLVRHHQ